MHMHVGSTDWTQRIVQRQMRTRGGGHAEDPRGVEGEIRVG